MQKDRDKALDARNNWEKVHKAMLDFRFLREVLNQPPVAGMGDFATVAARAVAAMEALHNLKGQLDRVPDEPLVLDIANFLNDNARADGIR
jgi:hypothetical protein